MHKIFYLNMLIIVFNIFKRDADTWFIEGLYHCDTTARWLMMRGVYKCFGSKLRYWLWLSSFAYFIFHFLKRLHSSALLDGLRLILYKDWATEPVKNIREFGRESKNINELYVRIKRLQSKLQKSITLSSTANFIDNRLTTNKLILYN